MFCFLFDNYAYALYIRPIVYTSYIFFQVLPRKDWISHELKQWRNQFFKSLESFCAHKTTITLTHLYASLTYASPDQSQKKKCHLNQGNTVDVIEMKNEAFFITSFKMPKEHKQIRSEFWHN